MKNLKIGGKLTVLHKEFAGWWDCLNIIVNLPEFILDQQQQDAIDGSSYMSFSAKLPTTISILHHRDGSFTSFTLTVLGFGFVITRQNGY